MNSLAAPSVPCGIAGYWDEETAPRDALVGKVEAAVEWLQEHRIALITPAVTGKIDVRGSVHDSVAWVPEKRVISISP